MAARTYLFVPGDRPQRFAKALASGADAVVLDLEDAVAPAAKADARAAVASCLAGGDERLVVRINDSASPWFADDLALLVASAASAVMLPKAETVADLALVRAACPQIALLPLVESARGVLAAHILAAAPGVQRLVFGSIDYALDLDLPGDPAGFELPLGLLALASRAAGIVAPVAGVTAAIDDETLLLADLARARAHGFGAKLCIHPCQVTPIHLALRPGEADLDWARRVLAAVDGAAGAVQVDGRMVDKPVVERARRLLARANR
jgi:citrate lyase subunit beta/citryl-CoA lyase